MQKFIPFITFCVAILSGVVFVYSLTLSPQESKVSFLSVGQGDAILIDAGNGNQLLIDSGRDERVVGQLGEVMKYGDKTIEAALITHYDFDHIGGFDEILESYNIDQFLVNNAPRSNKTSERLIESIAEREVEIGVVNSQSHITLGNGVLVKILYPFIEQKTPKGNEGSVVAMVYTKGAKYLLTGDVSSKIEYKLVEMYGNRINSDVLKLGHHGSKTSSSQVFLETVDPDIAIVSAGEGNQYGHPHKVVLDRLSIMNIPVLDTFQNLLSF